jgi:hypothetical protein
MLPAWLGQGRQIRSELGVRALLQIAGSLMRIYLAGPMSGHVDHNKPAFHRHAAALRAMGHEVFNPAESKYADEPTYRQAMREDLLWILDHAEAIALIPGWEKSKGVAVEIALARCLKLWEIRL